MYYNTKFLLATLDSLIESAHDRLTNDELQLLGDIRTGIAKTKSDQLIEDHFVRMVQFFLPIIDYIDKLL